MLHKLGIIRLSGQGQVDRQGSKSANQQPASQPTSQPASQPALSAKNGKRKPMKQCKNKS